MAERIDIIVSDSGSRAKVVKRDLDQIGDSADRSGRKVESLGSIIKTAFVTLGVAALTREVFRLSDSFVNLQNRLRTVTDGEAELAVVTERLFDISQRTRSSFEGTVELFARVGLAAKELGRSQAELLDFTESLNQAIILSGASATEAQAGLIQLSQGLASGALRGDELRSVLEQLPAVADVIASQLGVTRGELRDLGQQGKITADIVLDAFAAAREEIAERFGKSLVTPSQALTVLGNALQRTIGEFATTSGAAEAFSSLILRVAANVDVLVRSLASLAATGAIVLGFQAATRAVNTFTAAIAANPIGAIAVAITAAVSALFFFSDQITVTSDGVVTLRDLAVATFQIIVEAVNPFVSLIADQAVSAFNLLSSSIATFGVSVSDVFRFALNAPIRIFIAQARVAFEAINAIVQLTLEATERVSALLRALGADSFDVSGIRGKLDGFVEEIRAQLDPKRDFVGELSDGIGEQIADRARKIAEQRLAAQREQEAQRSVAEQGLTRVPERPATPDTAFQDLLADLSQQTDLLRLSTREREIQQGLLEAERDLKRDLTGTERELVELQLREIQQLEERNDIVESTKRPQDALNEQLDRYRELLDAGVLSQDRYNRALRAAAEDAISNLKTEQDELNEKLQIYNLFLERGAINEEEFARLADEAANAVDDRLSRSIDQLADLGARAFDDLVFGGESLSDTLRNVERAILDVITQVLILEPLAESLRDTLRGAASGSGSGGAGGFFGDLFKTILGGSASTPAPAGGADAESAFSAIATAALAGQVFERGGVIRGPGGPTDDRVPILASNGEFVVNAEATKRALPLLEAINSGDFLGRFARGGLVDDPSMRRAIRMAQGGLVGGFQVATVGGQPVAQPIPGANAAKGEQRPINLTMVIQTRDAESFRQSLGQIGAETAKGIRRAERRNT